MEPAWEELDHTADWALRIRGADISSLFKNAACGMASLVGGFHSPSSAEHRFSIHVEAHDWETLLVDWLTEVLYLIEDRHLVVTSTTITHIDEFALNAVVAGKTGDGFEKHIKAATYSDLVIKPTPAGFEVVIVFDV